MSGPVPTPRTNCQNCGAPLSGPYCSACGQHDVDYHRSFGHVLEDALEGVFHFDGKFLKSARYVFTRPGFLTSEFIAGRRTRYTNPVRFYFFASFLLFAVNLLTGSGPSASDSPDKQAPAAKAAADAVETVAAPKKEPAAPKPEETPAPAAGAAKKSWYSQPIIIDLDGKHDAKGRALADEFEHLLPAMLFFCVPVLALVLKLVYLGSRRLYVEHLIFALHTQAMAFLSFLMIWAGGWLGSLASEGVGSAVGAVLTLGMVYLIYRSLRSVYGQGRGRTAFKLVALFLVYGIVLIIGFLGLAAAAYALVARG